MNSFEGDNASRLPLKVYTEERKKTKQRQCEKKSLKVTLPRASLLSSEMSLIMETADDSKQILRKPTVENSSALALYYLTVQASKILHQ